MAHIVVGGIGIEYELLGGSGAPAVALTPGGRFSKDAPGIRELGEALAAGGKRVLLWDRPNCGLSDITFRGSSESTLQAHTLCDLIRALELGPATLAGGSGGARVSLIAAASAPELVSQLVLWSISGGAISLMGLATYYCGEAANEAARHGMAAVCKTRSWAEQATRNPRAAATILAEDPKAFIETMQRWAMAYRPSDDSPVPGMAREHFANLKMPVLIFRNGMSDVNHPRATSDWVYSLLSDAYLVEPPWPDDEWNNRVRDVQQGRAPGLFVNWSALASPILNFLGR